MDQTHAMSLQSAGMSRSLSFSLIFLLLAFASMAHPSIVLNHAFCAALRPLFSCKPSIASRPPKPNAAYVRMRKCGTVREAIYQRVEKAEDYHERKVELYKRIHDAARGQGGGELKEHIVVTRRQHRKQNHGQNGKGAIIEQANKKRNGQDRRRRRPTKAVSHDRAVATSTSTDATQPRQVDGVGPATADEDRYDLLAHIESVQRQRELINHAGDWHVHSASPRNYHSTRPNVHHQTCKARRDNLHGGSPRHNVLDLSNGDVSLDDRDPLSPQSPLVNDTLLQRNPKPMITEYVEKTVETSKSS